MNNEIARIFALEIKKTIDEALQCCNWSYKSENDKIKKFELIKKLASLVSELLEVDGMKENLIELANASAINGENNEIKIATFDLIRNILIHFPIYNSWDEICISKKLLKWNKPRNSHILKYFENNRNKSFTYRIFLNENNNWVERHTITVNIPKLDENNEIYLKDILSLDDAIWTFGIIDYYLKDLGLNIEPYNFTVSL